MRVRDILEGSKVGAGAVNLTHKRSQHLYVTNLEPVLSRAAVVALYTRLLEAWNRRDASGFAAQFAENGDTVGYDGSQLDGRVAIESELGRIFADHVPATYVARVREVRTLGGSMLLRAVAGMVPPDGSAVNPERHAIQSLVAIAEEGAPRIALYQNTPAQFHGRPELLERLTTELQGVVASGRFVAKGSDPKGD
jgi:uncharacterized protein (TIGR02246 family)